MPHGFPGLTTILFDADGTLWDFQQAMRRALTCALAELERLIPSSRGLLTIDALIAIRDRVTAERKGSEWTHEAERLEAFRRTLAYLGHPDEDLARGLTDLYLQHRFEGISLYDDVLPALDALRERYTLGLLTNGNTYPERCGLAGYFRFAIFGQDYALQKPDPRLFQVALQHAGCDKHQLVHVGDSLESDVIGARGIGIAAIWLNRQGQPNETGVRPDCEIASLAELLAIL